MLTNATVKAARAGARPRKIFDALGLYIYLLPRGRRSWRMRYRYKGGERLLTLGDFPGVDVGRARELRDEARGLLDRGVDPVEHRRGGGAVSAITAGPSFETVARRWYQHRRTRWSDVHAADVLASLERDVFTTIGATPIAAITAPMILDALRSIEARGRVETARRIRQRVSAVFRFAISEAIVAVDPAALISEAMAAPPTARRQPALVDLDEARALLAEVDALEAAPAATLASRFLALTAVRLSAVRGLTWDEIEDLDGDAPLWRIPAARMKLTRAKKADASSEHLVPLSHQAVELLRAAGHLAATGKLIFPGRSGGRMIGEGAIGTLYERTSFAGRHVPHGWRATFSTVMNQRSPENRAAIDTALAHAPKDKVEASYNRSVQIEHRRVIFQDWADLLIPR